MTYEFSTESTRIVWAAVLRLDLERLPEIKRALQDLGAEILYQRSGPLGLRLEITERKLEGSA